MNSALPAPTVTGNVSSRYSSISPAACSAWLPEGADEHETAKRARRSGVGLHELHRHCTTYAPSPQALLLGFALPSESDLIAATALLAEAIC